MRRSQNLTRLAFALSTVVACAASAQAGLYVDTVLGDNPVGYWRLEENPVVGNTAFDSAPIAGSQDGTYRIDTPSDSTLTAIAGPIMSEASNAVLFDNPNGSDGSLIAIPDPTGVLGSTGDWSVEFWLMPKSGGGTNQNAITKGTPASEGGGDVTFFNRTGTLQFGVNTCCSIATGSPADDQWVHVVGVLEPDGLGGTLATIYLDGQQANQAPVTGEPGQTLEQNDNTLDPLNIAALGGYAADGFLNFFNGALDEIAVYDYALTSMQVESHFQASLGVVPTPGKWRVDASGTWQDSGNWSFNTIPNDTATIANFAEAISQPRTVVTDTNVTVKGVSFDNANEYVIGGNGAINLQSDSGNASLTVASGSHQIHATLNLVSNTEADIATDSTLSLQNALNQGSATLTKTGGGKLLINNRLNDNTGDVNVSGGTLGGTGSIGGSLNNTSGTVAPGKSAGILTVEDNFTQDAAGTLEIEIGGLERGEQYDGLLVGGAATVNGAVVVELIGGFLPQVDDVFDVLDFNSFSGTPTFDFALADLGGGRMWDTSRFSAEGLLCAGSCSDVVTPPDGDFDASSLVDTADLNLVLFNWNNLGSELPQQWAHQRPGDAQAVGLAQLNLVLFNWNASSSATVAVPEPSCAALCALGLLGALSAGRRLRILDRAGQLLVFAVLPTTLLLGVGRSAVAGPYVDAVLADAPAGYWRLEETPGDGNTAFDSATANGSQDGAYSIVGSGSVNALSGPIVNESSNQAVRFTTASGVNGVRIEVPDPTGVLGTFNDWTIEYWMNRSVGGNANQETISKGYISIDDGGATFMNSRAGANQLDFGINSGAVAVVSSPLPLTDEWTHIVGVLEPNVQAFETLLTVYQNGVRVTQEGIPDLPFDNTTAPFVIGALVGLTSNMDGVNFFNGAVDEVAVYTKVLSPERVLAHYNASGFGAGDNVGRWKSDFSSSWNLATNWFQQTIPHGNSATARFSDAATAPLSVFTEEPVTVKNVIFDNSHEYVITGNHPVNLEADSGNASISVMEGHHQFQTAVNLDSDTLINTAGTTVLSFNNDLNLRGNTLTKDGSGTVNINNQLIKGGGMIVLNEGTVVPGDVVSGAVVSNAGGTLAPDTLSIAGDYTMNPGSTLAIEIGGRTAGEDYDVVSIGGDALLAGMLDIALVGAFAPANGDTFDILAASSIDADGLVLGGDSAGFRFSVAGDTLSLSYASIPEPASWVLVGLAAIGLLPPRRCRLV